MFPETNAVSVRRALLVTDLVDSTKLVARLGDTRATTLSARHDRLARDLLAPHGGREIDKTDGFLLLFEEAGSAVAYALAYHRALRELGAELGLGLAARAGVHDAEIVLRENPPEDVALGAKPIEVEGIAKPVAARLMSLATGGQTLLTRVAFDAARSNGIRGDGSLAWLAHGSYHLKGLDQAVEVFEVGEPSLAPLCPPGDSEKAKRAAGDVTVLGWRPAPGMTVPRRAEWRLVRRLGAGGFGEVWLARGEGSDDRVVFKFCFEVERLRALRREVTLFRLLKETLGDRDDIARLLDWSFDDSPYYLEMAFAEGGSLVDWARERGGLAAVPLATRLALLTQAAEAVAAAHSVGVLHKDLKPANLLVTEVDGRPRVRLTDFGISSVTEVGRLEELGITVSTLSRPGEAMSSSGGGTPRYMAPEVTEGKPCTIQADVFALGVILYQLVVGDLRRALAQGWERDVEDELLREDVAACVDGRPERRLASAAELARRVTDLDERRAARTAERRAHAAAARTRRRRRVMVPATLALAVFAFAMGVQARRIAREAERANREAAAAREVTRFLTELFDLADEAGERGDTVTARALLDRGAERVRGELAGEPATQARLMDAIGLAYMRLGLLSDAEPLIRGALATRRRLAGGDDVETAASLDSAGQLATRKRKYQEAEKLIDEALAIRRRRLGETHEEVAATLRHKAALLEGQGRYAESRPISERAGRIERVSKPEGDPVGARSRARDRLEVAREVDVPADADGVIGAGPVGQLALVRGAQGIYVIDLEGKSPPTHMPLAPDEAIVRGLAPGVVAIRAGERIVARRYLGEDRRVEDHVLHEGVDPGDVIALDPSGDVLARAREGAIVVERRGPGGTARVVRLEPRERPEVLVVGGGVVCWIGADRAAHVVRVADGRELLARRDWKGVVGAMAIDELSGKLAVAGWFDEVLVYDLAAPDVATAAPRRHVLPGKAEGLAFLPDRPTLVVGKMGRVVVLGDGAEPLAQIEAPASVFRDVSWGPAGVLVLDQTRRKLMALAYRALPVEGLGAVSGAPLWGMAANSTALFLGGVDGRLHRYEIRTGKLVTEVAHTQGVTSIAVVDDLVITASDDKTIAAWDARSLAPRGRGKAHDYLVNNLYWEAGSATLWSTSSDGTVKGWSLPDLVERAAIDVGHRSLAALWMDSTRGVGLVGTWDGAFLELARDGDGWRVARSREVASDAVYAAAELTAPGLVALLGVNPASLWIHDVAADRDFQVPLPDPTLGWISAVAPDRVALVGAGIVASYRFTRTADAIAWEVGSGIDTDVGELGISALLPDGRLAAGNGSGQLWLIDLGVLDGRTLARGELH